MLRGKNKPTYEPSQETGDYIVIVNADKVNVTGRKRQDKMTIITPASPAASRTIHSASSSGAIR